MMSNVTLTVNGDTYDLVVRDTQTLLDVIREQINLKGTKRGCTTGSCGVCTINNGNGEGLWVTHSAGLVLGLQFDVIAAYVRLQRRAGEGSRAVAVVPELQPVVTVQTVSGRSVTGGRYGDGVAAIGVRGGDVIGI